MATQPEAGLTYRDLESFPEDNFRRELIGGELIVTAAPSVRHQRTVGRLLVALTLYAEEQGGEALVAPTDVFFSDSDVVEPDVLFVLSESAGKIEKKFIRSAPDVVIEVSSPTTRRLEIVRKRELYERFGVPEYWYVDLEADRIEIYRLEGGRYPTPEILSRRDTLESPLLPRFSAAVDELLGPPDEDEPDPASEQ